MTDQSNLLTAKKCKSPKNVETRVKRESCFRWRVKVDCFGKRKVVTKVYNWRKYFRKDVDGYPTRTTGRVESRRVRLRSWGVTWDEISRLR